MKRFIRYLYEYEENQKKRNVGFVKVEQDGKNTTISVHGKGLCGKSNENISCYLIKMGFETGNAVLIPAGEIRIGMSSCGGCFCYTEEMIKSDSGKSDQERGQTCKSADNICGIGLGNLDGPFYMTLWDEKMYGDFDITKAAVEVEKDKETKTEERGTEQQLPTEVENVERASELPSEVEQEAAFYQEEHTEKENESANEEKAETQQAEEDKRETDSTDKAENRWETQKNEDGRIEAEFQENQEITAQKSQRQIMKIQRGEISILPRCEWRLANNNFLLHGYYNYRHLVLIDEGDKLKLGVPGIYHEREARAAAAFGFPEFIAEADVKVALEPQERNENQQFGYWCRQVRRPPRT